MILVSAYYSTEKLEACLADSSQPVVVFTYTCVYRMVIIFPALGVLFWGCTISFPIAMAILLVNVILSTILSVVE